MSALITTRFYNAWIPATWLSPVIRIVKESDGSVVIASDAVTEVSGGFYKYEFTGYSPNELYFFSIDWWSTLTWSDRYKDSINDKDSYWNKTSWGKNPNVVIDTQWLAKDIWDASISDHKIDGTFGFVVQKPITFKTITDSINKILPLVEKSIKSIRIPNNVTKNDIREEIEGAIANIDIISDVKKAIWDIEYTKSDVEKYDDTEINKNIAEIKNMMLDLINREDEVATEDENKNIDDIVECLKYIVNKLENIDSGIENKNADIEKINTYFLDLKNNIKNIFTRLKMK